MKERPILFSGSMVRAILEGRKSVTRRAVKPQYSSGNWSVRPSQTPRGAAHSHDWWLPDATQPYSALPVCPFGQSGDRLWVREAWAADAQVDSIAPRELSEGDPIRYLADGGVRQTGCAMVSQGKGRPSIHMPRWASRILLEITKVHVERLQEISLQQVRAEGCEVREFWLFGADTAERQRIGARVFESLWTSTGGDWDANPWVWVVEFKRVTP